MQKNVSLFHFLHSLAKSILVWTHTLFILLFFFFFQMLKTVEQILFKLFLFLLSSFLLFNMVTTKVFFKILKVCLVCHLPHHQLVVHSFNIFYAESIFRFKLMFALIGCMLKTITN